MPLGKPSGLKLIGQFLKVVVVAPPDDPAVPVELKQPGHT
jgi:hypothetical protein